MWVKYPLLLSRFNVTWTFSNNIRKIVKYQISWLRRIWAELFHADGQTERQADMTKLTDGFRHFVNAAKMCTESFIQ